ncbi:hypothetical protein [Deinococcus arcticus]|uniref:DUF2357 domain-containing protein n=1 Tax=Deinococcus arcticus TaxID=2136176 RepID=A0A2T3W4X2_9DEIO|nr:hypothetical protein [Deinococcus arcticus]PTA66922.1 hypothetical protein C8263_15245 [Deinococcus arcticus]
MSGQAVSRLTGAAAPLPGFGLSGLWISATSGLLNGLSVPARTPLLPDARGVLTWSAAPADPVTVAFPAPHETRAPLGSLEAALTGLALDTGGWADWLQVSPLDRDLTDELHRYPLEDAMERELPHLEEVCRKPRTHLEIFEERQLVSRARQIPVRAVNYLASHTEDWDARTLRGVRPRRVITNVRDDLYDIYENRVAARLVDHLTQYVRRRLARVRELLNGLDTIDLNAQAPPSGMHWRQRRVYRLWGESLDLTEAQRLGRERLTELDQLLYRLGRLKASPLYSQVPTKSQVPAQLRLTNILGNDPHYRRVARLWRSWHRHAHTGHASVQEQQQTAQHEAAQFDRYALLLTLHALQQFEFTPVADTALHPGATLSLRGPEGPTELTWQLDGTCSLQQAGTSILRVVASPTPFGDLRREDVSRAVAALREEARALTTRTLLLYPGNAQQTLIPELQAVSSDPVRLHPMLSCLPVSAVDLESVERLARVLRLVLTGARFTAYPPTFETGAAVPRAELPDVLQPRGPGGWALLGPLRTRPGSWTEEGRRRQQVLEDVKRQLATHNADRLTQRRAQREVERLQAELDEWTTFLTALEASEEHLSRLRRCPVCGTEGAEFSHWQDDQFHCECGDCGAAWSLRRCPACQQRHPWLLPHLHTVPTLEADPGWADRLYGRDVLTLPDPFDLDSFICPDARLSVEGRHDAP